jgi:DNA modification methylase
MSVPYKLYNKDFAEVTHSLSGVNCIITDPPYPDQYESLFNYSEGQIDFLKEFDCRQIVFWSARFPFPHDYTAIHIWDKRMGAGRAEYDRIFERNGQSGYLMFREYFINSTVAASYGQDVFTGHPSQKPIRLMRKLILKFTSLNDLVFDPFMGSGSTGVAALQLGRRFVGCELSPEYFAIAEKRISQAAQQPSLLHEAQQSVHPTRAGVAPKFDNFE